jgi:N-acetylmuramoyl-L-alanine amidase
MNLERLLDFGRSSSLVSARASAVLLALLSTVVAAIALASGATQLRSVQLRIDEGITRAALTLDGPVRHRFFMLDQPRRAVLDLRGVRLAPGVTLPGAVGAVTGLRSGQPDSRTLRLVFELDATTRAQVAAQPGGAAERLVLEFRGRAPRAAAPAATPAAAPAPIVPIHAPSDSTRPVVVAIDAGHGGTDPGAIGRRGTREKDVVLRIARSLAERINAEPGMRAVLTRQGDYFLTLRQRMQRARAARADMFVSVHADSVGNSSVSGSSVYVLSEKGATDEQARWLAERENAADLKGGVSQTLASVLLDLSQSASISASMEAAERVLRSLDRVGEVRKPQVQQAGFVVLKSPDIPSMLVETAYISNIEDERRLGQDEYRARLADAIFRGVRHYFDEHPPEGTRFALERRRGVPAAAAAGAATTAAR